MDGWLGKNVANTIYYIKYLWLFSFGYENQWKWEWKDENDDQCKIPLRRGQHQQAFHIPEISQISSELRLFRVFPEGENKHTKVNKNVKKSILSSKPVPYSSVVAFWYFSLPYQLSIHQECCLLPFLKIFLALNTLHWITRQRRIGWMDLRVRC